ncbi:MAG TPA: M48 family metalloprotease [Fimbriimonadaceae bacterium]|nr:M48 family metalloprotease [Fimbriimonadaceae bacterium]
MAALLMLLVSLTATSFADPVEQRDAGLRQLTRKLIRPTAGDVKIPKLPIPKKTAFVAICTLGTGYAVLILGAPDCEATRYAGVLERWRRSRGLPEGVFYGFENDVAGAAYTISEPEFGLMHGSTSIPIRSIYEAVSGIEGAVQVAVIVPELPYNCAFTFDRVPDVISGDYARVWKLSDERSLPTTATVSAAIGIQQFVLLAVLFFTLPASTMIAIRLVKRRQLIPGIPIDVLRKQYANIVNGMGFASLLTYTVLTVTVYRYRTFDSVTQLWWDMSFTPFLVPLLFLSMLVSNIPFRMLMKLEPEIMGPTPEERLAREALQPTPDRPPLSFHDYSLRLKALVCGWYVLVGISVTPFSTLFSYDWPTKGWVFQCFAVFAITLALAAVYHRVLVSPVLTRETARTAETSGAQHRLEDRLRHISELIGQPFVGQLLDETSYGRYHGAALKKNVVGVTPTLAERFEDAELDFILAHEAAHHVLGHRRVRFRLLFVLLVLNLCFVTVSLLKSAWTLPVAAILLLLVTGPMLWILPRWRRQNEFACDAFALRLLKDRDAAEQALQKITLASDQPGIHTISTSSHPAVQERIRLIQTMALS